MHRPTGPRLHLLRRRETRCICTPPPSCRAVVEEPSRCRRGPGARLAPLRAAGRSPPCAAVATSVHCTSTSARGATARTAARSPFAEPTRGGHPCSHQGPGARTRLTTLVRHRLSLCERCRRSRRPFVHGAVGRAQRRRSCTRQAMCTGARRSALAESRLRAGRAPARPALLRPISSSAPSGRRPSGYRPSVPCSAAAPTA